MADSTYTVARYFETDYGSVLGPTEHIPVLVESFELKRSQLYVDGEAFVDGGFIISLHNIHKIQQILAGTELILDNKVTKLLISNRFDDSAVEKIWKWYSDRDIRVECDRQTLPKPTAPDSTQDLETIPESSTTPESTITPLEPELEILPEPELETHPLLVAPPSPSELEILHVLPEPQSGTTPESTVRVRNSF